MKRLRLWLITIIPFFITHGVLSMAQDLERIPLPNEIKVYIAPHNRVDMDREVNLPAGTLIGPFSLNAQEFIRLCLETNHVEGYNLNGMSLRLFRQVRQAGEDKVIALDANLVERADIFLMIQRGLPALINY